MSKKQKHAHRTYSRFPEGYLVWSKFWKNARRTVGMAAGEAPSIQRAAKYQQFLKLQRFNRPLEASDIHASVDRTLGTLLGTAIRAAVGNGSRIDDPWVLEALIRGADMLGTNDDDASDGAVWHARDMALIGLAGLAITSDAGERLLERLDPSRFGYKRVAGDVISTERFAEAAPEDFDIIYKLLRTFEQETESEYNLFAGSLFGDVIDETALGRQERRQRARAAFDGVERATSAFIDAFAHAKAVDAATHTTGALRA